MSVLKPIRLCCILDHELDSYIGVPTKNPRTNELDSSMLKSKNQVTLFVSYSYNSFYDFRSSKINKANGGLCAKIWPLWDF